MAQSNSNHDPHNTGSLNKPPMLVREEYQIWSRRMAQILGQHGSGCWRSVVYGPYIPTAPSAEDMDVSIPKKKENYTDKDNEQLDLDAKAFSIITMALPNDIYAGLMYCKSAKEMWDALKEQFGGTDEVLENRKEILNQQYETFTHVNGESLTQQFERFSCLIGGAKSY